MKFSIGIKSDPVEYRYSFSWLFQFMKRNKLKYMQMGSFFELYSLDLEYFRDLRNEAEEAGITISSCFTAHRELGGFISGNPYFEKVAFENYRKFIDVASVVGSRYVGSNPGAVFRDKKSMKNEGIRCYLNNMKTLMKYAHDKGMQGLTIEPMSCSMEPPTTSDEIRFMMEFLKEYHQGHTDTVPVYLCSDTSHGLADENRNVLCDHESLFKSAIPYISEFHFKNTDTIFNSTFGFSEEDKARGIVDLERFRDIIFSDKSLWPVEHVIGYLEISGPKLGRDYSDCLLEDQLQGSIDALKAVYGAKSGTEV